MKSISATVRNLTAALALAGIATAAGAQDAALPAAPALALLPAPVLPATPRTPFAAALDRGLEDAALRAAYAERGDAPFWTADGRADVLLAALRHADAHALPAARYGADALAALDRADPAAQGRAEAALARAFLRYARDLSSGVLEPRRVAAEIKVQPPRPDPVDLMRRASAAPDLAAFLAALAPSDPDYRALLAAHADLTALARTAGWGAPVPDGPTLRPGERGPRVAALRARLAAMGDPDAGAAAEPDRFDAGLEAAVRRFQRGHGLNDDGAVGPATLAQINVGPAQRAGQVAVNIERLRWTNRPLAARRIMVNQADFTVKLIDDGEVLFEERVVVGTQRHQTPEFSDEMEHIVLNPTWHVPSSIATKELLPELQRDPGVLARRGMRLVRTDGGPLPLDPSLHDFSAYTPATFPYRIKQNPSDDNALGLVKFMFPNGDAIYLHDTPSKRLFNRDVRAFSHGCVRVRDPLRLAEHLLAPQQDDPRGFIDGVLAKGRERTVHLDAHVPVHLTYRTAWVDPVAGLQLRGDVYGRDAAVLAALRAAGVGGPDA